MSCLALFVEEGVEKRIIEFSHLNNNKYRSLLGGNGIYQAYCCRLIVTFYKGYLGSHYDEERSEVRKLM